MDHATPIPFVDSLYFDPHSAASLPFLCCIMLLALMAAVLFAASAVCGQSLSRQFGGVTANACRITAAFASGNYEMLAGAFEDHLHQPYREKALIPFLTKVITAGESAGALGGFLSGSGSTICCVTLEDPDPVMRAMLAAAPASARGIVTQADNVGAGQI